MNSIIVRPIPIQLYLILVKINVEIKMFKSFIAIIRHAEEKAIYLPPAPGNLHREPTTRKGQAVISG
ncbi:hypothetical protein Back11_56900 [Paenibacillus baekrokdamisoli]|uniref:Uncharacterized protein n=1 Tax=Paenibacillus baekrokdamisoli TaxID=1712516 RepID=A0A3G9J7N8_9BACL|nr:hypothetical protein Back11_56900 [Paenibacillus baekrokdamisoli]